MPNSEDIHPAFVKRLATEYFRRYKDVSPINAKKFARRMIGNDKELEKAVRTEVAFLIRSVLKGGKPSG